LPDRPEAEPGSYHPAMAAARRATPSGSVLFLIPARGGSRRAPGKNLRLIGGIPLVGWAARVGLEAARLLGGEGHAVVCSSDDDAIAAAARAWGAEALARPAAFATDDATSSDVVVHALERLAAGGRTFETIVLLQPTSPLTDPAAVAEAVRLHRARRSRVVAVVRSHPATWHLDRAADGLLSEVAPATAAPSGAVSGGHVTSSVLLTGAFYVVGVAAFRADPRFSVAGQTIGFEVEPDRAVDVDEPPDLVVAEALLATRAVRPVSVGSTEIGPGKVFVIAEAGVNHNGSLELARQLVDAAADTGADAVKFQTFDPAALAAADAPMADYQRRAGVKASAQQELLAPLALPIEAWAELQARAAARGLVFLSTPFDDGSAAVLDRLDVPAFKVGSGELTNLPFLARLARRGRPLLVSTGMADMVEVAAAVDTIRRHGDVPLALLHCVSSYPAAPADANLRAIETLRRAFGVPVGWSDHTPGVELAIAAVGLGARLIEKHLTLDRTMAGPDHAASLEPAAFRAMVTGIRDAEAALGNGIKAAAAAEADVARVARRSLYWRTSLDRGAIVGAEDLDVLRPAGGMAPATFATVVGRRTGRPVTAGRRVEPADLETESVSRPHS
jgi:N,N'-diacetyllegionaminate synthase